MGPRVGKVAELLGTPFMPWQQQVADVAFEIDPTTGLFAYREIIVEVMRQSGKSTLVLATEVDRCVTWEERQRCVYSAQTGWDARKKLLEDQVPMLEASSLAPAIRQIRRGAGNEGVLFRTGSQIDLMASGESSGHGRSIDLGVIDEAWKDEDDRREQALLPAMATRPWAQMLTVSTAGKSSSLYLRRKVEAGRHWAKTDPGAGMAYFEFSIPDDEDIDDPAVWRRYMPALCPTPGPCECSPHWRHTISEAAVAHARQSMTDDEFRRAWGNQWREQEHDRIIPEELWRDVNDEKAAPSDPIIFALDTLPDRSATAITAGGGGDLELIEHRRGTSWVAARAGQLQRKFGGRVVIDGGGPASSLVPDLKAEGVEVDELTNQQVVAACARIYDAIADGKVRFRPAKPFDEAVAGLAKKPVGDRWVWSRTSSTNDATPFMAATLSFAPMAEPERGPVIW